MHGDHHGYEYPLRPSPCTLVQGCIILILAGIMGYVSFMHGLCILFAKEVIRPQVPLRPPCYDFSPLSELAFDDTKGHHLTQARLG